jgi:hypothetical protein
MKVYTLEASWDYEGSHTSLATDSFAKADKAFKAGLPEADCHVWELVAWENGKRAVLKRAVKVSWGLPMQLVDVKP